MATCQPFQAGKEQQDQHLHHGGCALPSVYRGTVLLPRQASLAPPQTAPKPSSSSGRSATEERAMKIHSEAKRRRQERINAHLATLRKMIPDAKQMDKATLLARVVNQVKDLKRKATEVTQAMPVPPEANEVTVQCYTEDNSCRRFLQDFLYPFWRRFLVFSLRQFHRRQQSREQQQQQMQKEMDSYY